MYKGVANSPDTTITNNISESDTLIYVLDETRIPEPPNLMVLGTGVSAETIKVISIDGNALTVERGFQGVPRSWNAGTVIARNFTEYDYNALVENIKTLKENTDTNADDIISLMNYVGNLENLDTVEKSNIVLALNEIYQELAAHKAEITQQIQNHKDIYEVDRIPTDLAPYPTGSILMVKENLYALSVSDWEVGSIFSATGGNYTRDGSLRTINKHDDILLPNTKYELSFLGENAEMIVFEYQSDDTYIGSSGWQSSPYIFTTDENMGKYRLVFSYKDRPIDLVPEDIEDAKIVIAQFY
ncbi:MAG: hypothetical protein GX995_00300 [Clostridiales bacterium]|nr:hypothetical protein [Clostridiales bacterium]